MNILKKIKLPESRKLEFKESLPKAKKVVQTLVAFVNGAGGELLFGVSGKEREIVGINDPFALEEQITSIVHDSISPPVSPFFNFLTVAGKTLLSVQILAGSNKPYYVKSGGLEKGVFVRVGSSNRLAGREVISELQRQSRGFSYAAEMDFHYSLEGLQADALNLFFNAVGQQIYNNESLLKWNIAGRNNGDVLPTVTGLVLFGSDQMTRYDYAHIRLTRFLGKTVNQVVESREYSLPIVEKIETLCNDISGFLRKESYFEGPRRLERTIIPFFAIREAVVNALVHRDYSITGSSIKINVFDDRLEIISPGVLFGNLELSDLGSGLSECRNRTFVRIFRQLGLMEELGTGVARIKELCHNRDLKMPVFEEQGRFFRVTLWQEKTLADTTEQIVELLEIKGSLSTAELARRLNVHHNTILKHLKKLIADSLVVKKGSGNKTKYSVKNFDNLDLDG